MNITVMPIMARTIEFAHIEQVSALFTFRLGQVLLYYLFMGTSSCEFNYLSLSGVMLCIVSVVYCM
jgi:hypothetical protein